MSIKIKSKREGFRRCGIPHPIEEVIYPDDRFTPDEMIRLQAEPMLIVERILIEPVEEIVAVDSKPVRKSSSKSKNKKIQ
ncbi:MAG: HI1506-related protein [Thermodesulfobacteriota bacterium]|nr:HI1506-related protein [Thermodesulfobacteriota bacterium]